MRNAFSQGTLSHALSSRRERLMAPECTEPAYTFRTLVRLFPPPGMPSLWPHRLPGKFQPICPHRVAVFFADSAGGIYHLFLFS